MAVNDGWGKPPASDWGKPVELPKIETPAPWGAPAPAPAPIPAGTWGNANPDGSWGAPAGSDTWQTSPPLAPSPAVTPPVHDEIDLSTPRAPLEWGKTLETPTWSLNDINGDAWPTATPQADDGAYPRYFQETDEEYTVLNVFEIETPEKLNMLYETVENQLTEMTADEYVAYKSKLAYDDREQQWTEGRISGAEERISVVNSLSGKRDEWVMETDGELNRKDEVMPTPVKGEEVGFYNAYHSGKWLYAVLSGPYSTKSAAHMKADEAFKRMTEDSVFQLAFQNKFERGGMYVAEIPLRAKRSGAYGVLA